MTDAAPTISAVMAARDAAATIGDALDALVAQQPPLHEIIVVVDGADPATVAAARRRPVEVFPIAACGLGAALTVGIDRATGEVIALADADDVVQPGWAAGLGRAFQAGADHVACRLAPTGRTAFGQRLTRYVGGHDLEARNGFAPSSIGAGQSFRRSAVLAAGGYDPTLGSTCDTDLAYRLALVGAPPVACDDAVVEYLTRDDLGSFLKQRYIRAYFGELQGWKYRAFAYARARARADQRSIVAATAAVAAAAVRRGRPEATDAAVDLAGLVARRAGITVARADLRLGRVAPPAALRPTDAEQRRTAPPLPAGPVAVVRVPTRWAGAVLAAQLGAHPDLAAVPPGLASRVAGRWDERCPWAPRVVDEAVAAGWGLHRDLAARRLDDLEPADWAAAYVALHQVAAWLDGKLATPFAIEVGADATAASAATGLPVVTGGTDDVVRELVAAAGHDPGRVLDARTARAAAVPAWLRRLRPRNR